MTFKSFICGGCDSKIRSELPSSIGNKTCVVCREDILDTKLLADQ